MEGFIRLRKFRCSLFNAHLKHLVGLSQLVYQIAIAHDQVMPLKGFTHNSVKFNGIPGLGDIAENIPIIYGGDYRLNIGIACEKQPDSVRVFMLDLAEEL